MFSCEALTPTLSQGSAHLWRRGQEYSCPTRNARAHVCQTPCHPPPRHILPCLHPFIVIFGEQDTDVFLMRGPEILVSKTPPRHARNSFSDFTGAGLKVNTTWLCCLRSGRSLPQLVSYFLKNCKLSRCLIFAPTDLSVAACATMPQTPCSPGKFQKDST